MVQEKATVNLKTGLQARPAAFFVQEANRFVSDVYLEKDNKRVNAKSIMGIMSLAVGSGVVILISAEGNDEEEAVKKLKEFVEKEE
ncbi:HPr family phosphocarrier protein [Aneurinibacillus sp. Ricciae_BoGa-3]|uniref:HPr family phosphocarrier protein n=1 Tax=Aneurinibacillus sp. Ricciae_BoGa-3 TaxID=3022697 RepID=UPI00234167E9|nr:HPr family phosphocarrier protein [Aneurinibacillus sp. Ricciae_BoGa-3]WCK54127.1 HPr family phosphocarrier protein [Aneurinibacillus sp. Ricciae_BoGa-3]